MSHRNMLIDSSRVETLGYYKKWRRGFQLIGFINVTEYVSPPAYDTWTQTSYNRFSAISHKAMVDGKLKNVLPVFVNAAPVECQFDGEPASKNQEEPAIVFFLGNDDSHYAMRYGSYRMRDEMIRVFGEDLGLLYEELIYVN